MTRPHYHVAANVTATLYTSQTHQSHCIITLTLVTLTQLAFSHLSPLPCSFCLSQCKGLQNPSDCRTAVASVTLQSHSSHCLRFLVSLLCTALIRQLSVLGYNTGKGKTAVLSMWVTQLQVRCDILSPVATPYPLSRYHRLKQVFLLYNYK